MSLAVSLAGAGAGLQAAGLGRLRLGERVQGRRAGLRRHPPNPAVGG